MAFPFRTGVHMASKFLWDAKTYPNEFNAGAVRTIVWPDDPVPTPAQIATFVDDAHAAGKFVVLCVTPSGNLFSNVTPATFANYITTLDNAGVSPDAWEIGNEPGQGTGGAVGGPYWPILRAVAARLKTLQPTIPRILAAPFSDSGINAFYDHGVSDYTANGGGLTILDDIDAWAIHLYAKLPADAQAKLTSARSHVDSYAQPWTALPVYITEFGWPVYDPKGTSPLVVNCPTQATNATTQMQYFVNQRTALKIAGAFWYSWADLEKLNTVATGFYGLKKNRFAESVASCVAGVQPSPLSTSNNGYRASKAAMDAFQPGYDLPAATAPDAITDPAQAILQTQAGLRGRVNPHNLPTTRTFQWGTTASYGSETTGAQVTGNALTAVQFQLTGLLPGHIYHYRTKAVSSAGTAYGADQQFTTASPPLPPNVTTGPVTTPTTKSAVLNGSVNPNGVTVTDYHFEWGLTSALGGSLDPGTLASGTKDVPVSSGLSGLTQGSKIYYRLLATNSVGTTLGVIKSFIVSSPPTTTAPDLTPVTLIPLVLAVEIVTRDGDTHHMSEDATWIGDRPLNLEFGTQVGDGFAESSFELERQIDLRWSDLDLLNRIRYIGADGAVAWEGRIVGLPRSVDEEGQRIEVQCTGLMASARDDPFTDIIVDRSADGWQNASLDLRQAYMDAEVVLDTDYQASVDSGSLVFRGQTNKKINGNSQAVLEYFAPTGVKLRRFSYKGTEKRISPNVKPARLHGADADIDTMGHWAEVIDLNLDGNLHGVTLQRARSILGLRIVADVDHGSGGTTPAPANPSVRKFRQVAAYADHHVPLQDNGAEPEGVFASDVINYLIGAHCPLLNANKVSPTSYVIEHLVFDQPISVFDALTLINGYHLWHLGAYEGGTVTFRPYDLTAPDWLVKSTDRGVTLDVQGDTIDQFANGILVSYSDLDQRDQDLHPADYADLRDDDPDNPANKAGIRLTTSLDITNPITRKDALAIGRAALGDFNRPRAPGNISVSAGYVREALSGIPQPGWKVRCGQTIAIQDQPFNGPRLITATHWDDNGILQLTLEQPPPSIDAIVARLQNHWDASGQT